jgi:hypothetical protein
MTSKGNTTLTLSVIFSEQEQELQDKQIQDEGNQEYVSAETV